MQGAFAIMDRDAILKELFAETLRIVELERRIAALEARPHGESLADLSTLVTLHETLSAARRNCEFLRLKLLAAG